VYLFVVIIKRKALAVKYLIPPHNKEKLPADSSNNPFLGSHGPQQYKICEQVFPEIMLYKKI
jgi:hypothetical protein